MKNKDKPKKNLNPSVVVTLAVVDVVYSACVVGLQDGVLCGAAAP